MITYKVDGMTCQGCARSVTNIVSKNLPGAKVAVRLDDKMVDVETSETPDEAKLKSAIEAAGFSFLGRAA